MNSNPNSLFIFRSHWFLLLKKWMIITSVMSTSGWILFLMQEIIVRILQIDIIFFTGFILCFLLLFLALFVTSFIHWRMNVDIITDSKLNSIRLQGIFHYFVEDISLEKIKVVYIQQEGLFPNLLSYGNVIVKSDLFRDEEGTIVLKNIADVGTLSTLLKRNISVSLGHVGS